MWGHAKRGAAITPEAHRSRERRTGRSAWKTSSFYFILYFFVGFETKNIIIF